MAKVRSAQQEGLYSDAVKLALLSWEHIDGMMQHARKYEDREFGSIDAIDVVLKYAPLLFDFQSLRALETLLKNERRIERDTSENLTDNLATARALMWDAHRLWDHLEQHPDARQDELRTMLGGDQDRWRSLAEAWDKMCLVRRTPEANSYRLTLCTHLDEVVAAKCCSCGTVAKAPKATFLENLTCAACGNMSVFVILCNAVATDTKE